MNNLILALSIFLLVQEINYRGFDLGFSGVYHSPLNDREHHPRFLDTAGDYLIAGVLPLMEGNFERKKKTVDQDAHLTGVISVSKRNIIVLQG